MTNCNCGAPVSKQMRAENVGGYYLTTALWIGIGGGESYETGVRIDSYFRLLQHDGRNWEKAHEHVKRQILNGIEYDNLKPLLRDDEDN